MHLSKLHNLMCGAPYVVMKPLGAELSVGPSSAALSVLLLEVLLNAD